VAASPGASFSFGLGLPHLQVADTLVRLGHPLRWAGVGGGLALGGELRGADGLHRAALGLPLALVHDRFGHAGVGLSLQLGYAYLHRVAALGEGAALLVGAQAQGQVALQYYLDWDEEHAYWLSTYDVGPAAALTWRPAPAHRLAAQVSLPLLGLVSRPPELRTNKIDPLTHPGALLALAHQGLSPATLDRHAAVQAEVSWGLALSPHWGLRAAYSLQYRQARLPRPVTLLAQGLQVEVSRAL
jgi:hypothetical protein